MMKISFSNKISDSELLDIENKVYEDMDIVNTTNKILNNIKGGADEI